MDRRGRTTPAERSGAGGQAEHLRRASAQRNALPRRAVGCVWLAWNKVRKARSSMSCWYAVLIAVVGLFVDGADSLSGGSVAAMGGTIAYIVFKGM